MIEKLRIETDRQRRFFMEEYWKKRLPILCGALGGAMLATVHT